MRFKTEYIDIPKMIDDLQFPETKIMNDEIPDRVSFNFDFPDIKDDSIAENLEPTDGDIQIMVELFLAGNYCGIQEHFYEDQNEEEQSCSLSWENGESYSYH